MMLFLSFGFPIILSCIGISAFIIGAFTAANSGSIRDWAIIGGIPTLIVILILLVGKWDVREFRADKYDLTRLAADHNAVIDESSEDEPYVFHSRFFKFDYWAYRIPNDDYSEYLITNNSVEDINNDE